MTVLESMVVMAFATFVVVCGLAFGIVGLLAAAFVMLLVALAGLSS